MLEQVEIAAHPTHPALFGSLMDLAVCHCSLMESQVHSLPLGLAPGGWGVLSQGGGLPEDSLSWDWHNRVLGLAAFCFLVKRGHGPSIPAKAGVTQQPSPRNTLQAQGYP